MFESLNNNYDRYELPFTTEGHEFKKLKDVDRNKEHRIFGFFITESKKKGYSDTLTLITEECFINLPARYVDKFNNDEKAAFWSGKYSLYNIKDMHTDSGDTVTFEIKETHPDYAAPIKKD